MAWPERPETERVSVQAVRADVVASLFVFLLCTLEGQLHGEQAACS